jgi:MoxR-like ATPase
VVRISPVCGIYGSGVGIAELTSRQAVIDAVAEYDDLGRVQFLAKYGFSGSRAYWLVIDGRRYDSKAIAGAAHGFEHPELGPLSSDQFSGGEAGAVKQLRAMGFTVEADATVDQLTRRFLSLSVGTLANGAAAPHKPLLCLILLRRVLEGRPRLVSPKELADELAPLLRQALPDVRSPSPWEPIWRLEPEIFEIVDESGDLRQRISQSEPPVTDLRRDDVLGGLTTDTYGALSADHELVGDIQQRVVERYLEHLPADVISRAVGALSPPIPTWWVNQGQTYVKERDGSYIWAPQTTKGGFPASHHTAVRDVRKGDRIVHYAGGALRATSVAVSDGGPASRPHELSGDAWEPDGYRASVEYTELDEPILLGAIDHNLRETAGGPFTSTGAVKQGYLYRLSEHVGEHLAELLGERHPSSRLWAVYVGQNSEANLRHSLPTGKWGWKQRQDNYSAMQPGDILAFAVGYSGGSPRVPLDRFITHGFDELVICRVMSPVRTESTTYWPDEVDAVVYPHRVDIAQLNVIGPVAIRDLDDRFGVGFGDSIRLSGINQSRAQLVGGIPTIAATTTENEVPDVIPASFSDVVDGFSEAVRASGLDYGSRHRRLIASFLAALTTKPFVIFTGLSGSGKSRLALALGQWLGDGAVVVLPVRPDWTSPDALLGYRDALAAPSIDGQQPWVVPDALTFMLKAARHPEQPYVLVLDEMNLAHVERYFADVLSGMESGQGILPDLEVSGDGRYFERAGSLGPRPLPDNLFIVGTVNVDETTYMFSPKVLDRANCFEFRVETADLRTTTPLIPVASASPQLVAGFLNVARTPSSSVESDEPFETAIRGLHQLLARFDREFGHRTFQESVRFARRYREFDNNPFGALDLQVLQKILPRLHGSRRELTDVLNELGRWCFYSPDVAGEPIDAADHVADGAVLSESYSKIHRMARRLRDRHFASFAE